MVADRKDYFKPIITPYELFLALTAPPDGAPSWGTDWISDFEKVMSLNDTTTSNTDLDTDIPHFSLVTGKLVYAEKSRPMLNKPKTTIEYDVGDGALVKAQTDVAIRKDGSVAVRGVRSLAGEKLRGRTWMGLDGRNGEDEGAEVEIGRDGVARGYRLGGTVEEAT
jgi:diphthamide biosynthesis protein 2